MGEHQASMRYLKQSTLHLIDIQTSLSIMSSFLDSGGRQGVVLKCSNLAARSEWHPTFVTALLASCCHVGSRPLAYHLALGKKELF